MQKVTEQEIQAVLEQDFPDSQIVVRDPTGDSYSFQIYVKSNKFSNLIRVKQHQLVMKSLKPLLAERLHAVAIKTTS